MNQHLVPCVFYCSMGFISGLVVGQAMVSTPWFSRKSIVGRAVWGGALSWTRTKLFWKMAPEQCKRRDVCTLAVQHNNLTFPTIVKSSPYNDRWTDNTISSLLTDINVPLTLPPPHPSSSSVWCNLNLDSSVKTHCRRPANTLRNNNVVITSKRRHFDVITSKWRRFDVITTLVLRHVFRGQWRMSQTRWRLTHWWRHQRCIKVSPGRRASLRERYLSAGRLWVMVCTDMRSSVRRITWARKLEIDRSGVGCCFLLKLEYYSIENLLKFIFNKTMIFPA